MQQSKRLVSFTGRFQVRWVNRDLDFCWRLYKVCRACLKLGTERCEFLLGRDIQTSVADFHIAVTCCLSEWRSRAGWQIAGDHEAEQTSLMTLCPLPSVFTCRRNFSPCHELVSTSVVFYSCVQMQENLIRVIQLPPISLWFMLVFNCKRIEFVL